MATTRPKLWLTTSRIRILNVVTFLMLTAVTVADEGNSTRQCYWCGPIAEQVHRSEVAPPCGPEKLMVFNCQEGHNYCAIAASSPPYVESRFCSKVYQDECYPQYCNTTKKWRMTCTCRGDFCNENITKRETDAFAKLPRQVEEKETREKRDTKSANLVLSASEKTVIITNLTSVQIGKIGHTNVNGDDNHTTQLIVPEPKISVHTISTEAIFLNPSTPSEPTESKEMINVKDTMTTEDGNDNIDKVDNIKVERKNEITVTSVKESMLPKIIGTTKMTKTKETIANTNTPRPSEQLPSAEALQQEASSENDHENTEHTTADYEPTESGTSDGEDDENVTTEPNDSGESSAKTNDINMFLFLNGLLLQLVYNCK